MKRADIEKAARQLIGSKWLHQGRNIHAGIDCIGGVLYVAKEVGYFSEEKLKEIDVLDYARLPLSYELLIQKMQIYFDEIPISETKEGDVLAFRMAGERMTSHVGTVVKGQREYMVVHSLENKTTIEEPLRRWGKFITHAFRFKNIED